MKIPASALTTLILVFTACGNDVTATLPATQNVPLTTVIAMAKANEIREIQVDGNKLIVYPKSIARGGADRFVSRIGDDTELPGVGQNLWNHFSTQVTFKVKEGITLAGDAETVLFFCDTPPKGQAPPTTW